MTTSTQFPFQTTSNWQTARLGLHHVQPKCINCGQTHHIVSGSFSSNCSMIGCRTSRSRGAQSLEIYSNTGDVVTIPMPTTIREQAVLFDQIWFWFVEMKSENAESREQVVAQSPDKGALRATVPLLWLQGKRCDGSKCQTRNQENWENVWKSLTHTALPDGSQVPVAWLTLRAFPSPGSPTISSSFLAR